MGEAFEREYASFMKRQIEESTGERRRRLVEAEHHAERLFLREVWWPLFGNFDRLHAEWEVADVRRGFRYLDFAYLAPPLRIDLEIEGFGPHAKYADRRKFEDDHLRAAFLQAEGWKVIRLSYDTVKERPEVCRTLLALVIGRWAAAGTTPLFTESEKELIRLAIRRQSPVTPGDVSAALGVCDRTARRRLRALAAKGAIRPARGSQRVRAYELCAERTELFLGL